MNTERNKVTILLYDISNGMASSLSPMFLGKQIEGIWHTGLVVYGNEYYYGGGVCVGVPKVTIYIMINFLIFKVHTIWNTRKRNSLRRNRNSIRNI